MNMQYSVVSIATAERTVRCYGQTSPGSSASSEFLISHHEPRKESAQEAAIRPWQNLHMVGLATSLGFFLHRIMSNTSMT